MYGPQRKFGFKYLSTLSIFHVSTKYRLESFIPMINVHPFINHERFFHLQVELVQQVVDGVGSLIKMEKRLEQGGNIEDLIPKSV